jgi:hypothetical protein
MRTRYRRALQLRRALRLARGSTGLWGLLRRLRGLRGHVDVVGDEVRRELGCRAQVGSIAAVASRLGRRCLAPVCEGAS